jgi:IS30 family transposase
MPLATMEVIWDTDENFDQEGIVMKRYHQITPEERYTLAALRAQQPRLSNAEIARRMGRHPSTIGRELRRNAARGDGAYRAAQAQEHANARRSRTRHWSKLTAKQWMLAEDLRRFQPGTDQRQTASRRRALREPRDHLSIYLGQ